MPGGGSTPVTFVDPTYGNNFNPPVTVTWINDSKTDHNIYFNRPATNANSSYVMAVNAKDVAGTNSQLALYSGGGNFIKNLGSIGSYDWRGNWDRLNSSLFYTHAGSKLIALNVDSGTQQVLMDLSTVYGTKTTINANGPWLSSDSKRIMVILSGGLGNFGVVHSYSLPSSYPCVAGVGPGFCLQNEKAVFDIGKLYASATIPAGYGVQATVQSVSESGSVVTITLESANPSGYVAGGTILLSGVSNAGYNGVHTLTAVGPCAACGSGSTSLLANQAQFTSTTTGLGSGTGGSMQTACEDNDREDVRYVGHKFNGHEWIFAGCGIKSAAKGNAVAYAIWFIDEDTGMFIHDGAEYPLGSAPFATFGGDGSVNSNLYEGHSDFVWDDATNKPWWVHFSEPPNKSPMYILGDPIDGTSAEAVLATYSSTTYSPSNLRNLHVSCPKAVGNWCTVSVFPSYFTTDPPYAPLWDEVIQVSTSGKPARLIARTNTLVGTGFSIFWTEPLCSTSLDGTMIVCNTDLSDNSSSPAKVNMYLIHAPLF